MPIQARRRNQDQNETVKTKTKWRSSYLLVFVDKMFAVIENRETDPSFR